MATSSVPRTLPKHLKATYLADQEMLLEETRATALFYFPGVVVWLLVFGFLTYIAAADVYGWTGLSVYNRLIPSLSLGPFSLAKWLFFIFLILFVIGLFRLLVRYLRWISTVYAVTSRRVIVQRGILGRNFDEIPVLQVRGVDVHQSFGERLLGYGTIRVSSEGGRAIGNEDWKGIPRPFRFQKLIENATINLQSPASIAGAGTVGRP